MKKSILPRVCKFSLTILATFVLGTVFIFANQVQAFAEEATEYFTLNQHHIDMIQEAFNDIVPPREMRMEIDLQNIWDNGRMVGEIMEVLLAPVYDVIDEIIQDFIALSGPNTRSNITLHEITIDVDHELACSIKISINATGDFIVTNISYGFYKANFEAFLTQNYVIEPFSSQFNRFNTGTARINDAWSGAHAATINTSIAYFWRDDGVAFIREGDAPEIAGWFTIIDPRMISSIDIWGRGYNSNGTARPSVSQSFRIYHVRPAGGTTGGTWFVNARPTGT